MRKPWLSCVALEFINTKISKDSCVFEWGAGSSTVWFAERVKEVTSVENEFDIAKSVEEELFSKGLLNVNLKYRNAEKNTSTNILNPEEFASNEDEYLYQTFGGYVLMIDNLKQHYDFVSVDGRARLSCVFHARKWVKPGGWIMLDDSERSWYGPAIELMQDWPVPVVIRGREGKTTHFWQKDME
jgi:tRNA A58 N-methylase Trm61